MFLFMLLAPFYDSHFFNYKNWQSLVAICDVHIVIPHEFFVHKHLWIWFVWNLLGLNCLVFPSPLRYEVQFRGVCLAGACMHENSIWRVWVCVCVCYCRHRCTWHYKVQLWKDKVLKVYICNYTRRDYAHMTSDLFIYSFARLTFKLLRVWLRCFFFLFFSFVCGSFVVSIAKHGIASLQRARTWE